MQGHHVPANDEPARARMRLKLLGFVFQFHFLLTEFSALMNVMLPMRALGEISEHAMKERAMMLLDLARAWKRTHTSCRDNSRAASASASRSLGRWPTSRR